jgi:radical SAM protein with 4Fe4S-binding SPASM domain
MEQHGRVLKLYPLLGVALSLLCGEKNVLMRCGAGWINYAIQTDGYLIPCPTMWGMKKYYLGHITDADPLTLKKLFVAETPCSECSILGMCGGRCLYTNIVKRWPDDVYGSVCHTVKELIVGVEAELPRIRRLIASGRLRLADFDYVKFNGAEIIP